MWGEKDHGELQEPNEQLFVTPPLLVVEVLSPEDRMSRMYEKLEDYFAMGCGNIWILDPHRRKAYRYDGSAITEVQEARRR
jgi:Uma2 family endonuclease